MTLGFYIDNDRCFGCSTCSMACTTTKLPGNRAVFMRRVRRIRSEEPRALSFVSMSCNHCADPACLRACPQGAYEKLDNGIVRQSHDKCIGCRACIEACPYDAPAYDEESRSVYKCDLCADRLDRGQPPACVESCPGANIAYGELDDLRSQHPDAADRIPGVTPDPAATQPSLLIRVDRALVG
ncbi:4Fe-4S dicluster domain-containing protein [Berryella wangjianweii]|uniref:4Fe-4S dicluster domain-containing protein n=1 Tax=Berryella wangjianweii TaxID=2734634 RepID=A0A6M8J6S9_9ACTN|nr:4Fe-4S dicluster domain-containing protein [Berryella wangjianweii]QKF07089.1 4Fe-4S dicluster domain-containing protein [Berryella wangjianweii]